jgi:hypothetical protein
VTRAPGRAGEDGCVSEGSRPATDYWLSKLFYDLQQPVVAAAYRTDRTAVLAGYPLEPDVRDALFADDVERLAGRTNPYLLRYYFGITGMSDAEFVRRIRTTGG